MVPVALIDRFWFADGFLTALRISVVADFGACGVTFFALLRAFLGVGAFFGLGVETLLEAGAGFL